MLTRVAAVVVGALAVVPATTLRAQPSATEAEVLALRADLFDPATLRADPVAVRAITVLLDRIRKEHPDVRGIRAGGVTRTILMVMLHQPIAVCATAPPARQAPVLVEPAAVVAVVKRFGGTLRCGARLLPMLIADFPALLYAPSLVAQFTRLAPVQSAEENLEIGGSAVVQVERTASRWRVVLGAGSGDCLAGCIDWTYGFFEGTPDGPITRVSDWRREGGRESGRQPWPVR